MDPPIHTINFRAGSAHTLTRHGALLLSSCKSLSLKPSAIFRITYRIQLHAQELYVFLSLLCVHVFHFYLSCTIKSLRIEQCSIQHAISFKRNSICDLDF